MKKAKQCLAAMLAAGMAAGAAAAEIRLEQAETAVGNWIARGGAFGELSGGGELSGETLEDPDTGAKMHVVRVPGKGFAVTSADDGIDPIILFSDGEGDFVPEPGSPLWDLLRWDLSARQAGAAEEAAALRRGGDGGASSPAAASRAKWAELLAEPDGPAKRGNGVTDLQVGSIRRRPLLETRWNQSEGSYGGIYNLFTPGKTEVTTVAVVQASAAARAPGGWTADTVETNELGHYPVGCVAVAGGQVMRYWKHPQNASPATVPCQVDGETRELEFYGSQVVNGVRTGSYGWDSMGGAEPVPGLSSEYVSRLLSDVGVACGAHYQASGTSMALAVLAGEMETTFGYASAVYHAENLSGTGLREVLVPNLDAGAPVMLGIGHAHAVVADGYGFDRNGTTFYIHVNLGWGQAVHYWYAPPYIDRYSSIDEIVCNVFPDFSGVVLSGRVTGPNGRPVCRMDVLRDGGTHAATATGADGIYHFRLAPGTYRVWPQNRDGTAAADPQEVALPAMSRTSNGNRILDFRADGAATVADIAVGGSVPRAAKGETAFSEPFEAVLSCATEGAEIRYTLDGSEPCADSPLCEGPIAIQATTTLRAVAFADGMECSAMLEETYTFSDPQSRDDFADARTLYGAAGRSSFDNAGYTKEDGEPRHSNYAGGASAWAKWTAPADGDWTFWLEGTGTNGTSELDTQLAIYTGDEVGSLSLTAANDNSPAGEGYSSRLSFHAEGGTEYKIAMDTFRGAEGTLLLRWEEGYLHWVTPDYTSRFVPRSGGRHGFRVQSSAGWRVVEYTAPVEPETMEGASGDDFVFEMPENGTGAERTGSVTFQAANSERVPVAFIQHPSLDFATARDEALERAWRENKRILLVHGREGCGYTRGTLFSMLPSAAVKAVLDEGYVVWFNNCDVQASEAYAYTSGLGYYNLPLIAIIDPQVPSAWVDRTTRPQSAAELLAMLEAHADWGGILQVATETLPAASAGSAYEAVLAATGGTPPYAWGLKGDYTETNAPGSFAETGTAQGWQGDDKCWNLPLPFAFPFFGGSYTNAKINSNGAISFGTADFSDYSSAGFRSAPVVAALWRDLTTEGGDIFVESAADAVTVRWSGKAYGIGGAVAFAATLRRDGTIVLSYGPGNAAGGLIGISAGDGSTALVPAKSNSGSMDNAADIVFTPPDPLPPGLELTADGVLRGMLAVPGTAVFTVAVTDAKGMTVSKELSLAVEGSGGAAATETTPVPVPHAWLADHGLGGGTAEGFETAANAAAANGMPVWACYVAGLDPADAAAAFKAAVSFDAAGRPVLESVSPDLGGGRSYILVGKKDLMEDTWADLTGNPAPASDGYRFFGAAVSMPE